MSCLQPGDRQSQSGTCAKAQISTMCNVQCAEWMTLICALRFADLQIWFADFLRLCLSTWTTSPTISFSISNSFYYYLFSEYFCFGAFSGPEYSTLESFSKSRYRSNSRFFSVNSKIVWSQWCVYAIAAGEFPWHLLFPRFWKESCLTKFLRFCQTESCSASFNSDSELRTLAKIFSLQLSMTGSKLVTRNSTQPLSSLTCQRHSTMFCMSTCSWLCRPVAFAAQLFAVSETFFTIGNRG